MSEDLDEFKSYCALADQLFEVLTPEQLAECLRVMSVHLAEYRARFGHVERPDLLEVTAADEVTDEHARLLRDGMELLVGYLASARDGWGDEDAPVH